MTYAVRFSEYEYYNIHKDENWVRFMATTTNGTFFTEKPRTSAMIYRENKEAFKAKVMELLLAESYPCEVNLD